MGTILASATYGYDLDGNRTSRTSAAGTQTATYAPGFQLLAMTGGAGAEAYGYDGGGRVTSVQRPGQDLTLGYDSDDQLETVTDQSTGQTTTYTTDALGRRVAGSDSAGSRPLLVRQGLRGRGEA